MEMLGHYLLLAFLALSHVHIVLGVGAGHGHLSKVYGLNRIDRSAEPLSPSFGIDTLNRSSFPDGFVFGAGTSAYQIEGAWNVSGKGPSNWDYYLHTYPDRMPDQSNGDVATDSYNLYEEDIKLVKKMNMDSYRLSISWSRVLPNGTLSGGVNEDGIDYYNKVINKILEHRLKPYVTIFHFDVPHALDEAYGGFLSHRIINDFVDFANLCFSRFGDRVRHWVTINEGYTFTSNGYAAGGAFAPQRCSSWVSSNCTGGDSGTEPYNVTHHLLLAHAHAVNLYKTTYQAKQQGKIGMTVVAYWLLPLTNSTEDLKATVRGQDFTLGWFVNPMVHGDYPSSMKTNVGDRLPKFKPEDSKLLKGSYDFIGLNYYTSRYCVNNDTTTILPDYFSDIHASFQVDNRNGKPIGQLVGTDFIYMYPKGIWRLLQYMKKMYNDPIIYITENGVDEVNDPSLPLSVALIDNFRINYYYRHLVNVRKAIEQDGVQVKGYFGWSVLDNFEFMKGYTVRFGINYVNFTSLERYQKLSSVWFQNILQT